MNTRKKGKGWGKLPGTKSRRQQEEPTQEGDGVPATGHVLGAVREETFGTAPTIYSFFIFCSY